MTALQVIELILSAIGGVALAEIFVIGPRHRRGK